MKHFLSSFQVQRLQVLWLLFTASLVLTLWDAAFLSLLQHQLGMRSFLQATFTGDPLSAQRWLWLRLKEEPTDALTHFFLGKAYLQLGDIQAGVEQWEVAGAQEQLKKLAADLIQREMWPEALAALEAVTRLDETDVESRQLLAKIWREQGNTERSLALQEEIIVLAPEDVEARWYAADIYKERGDKGRALALAQEMIAIDPEQSIGYALSGQILFEEGQYESAIVLFKEALKQNPANPHSIDFSLGRSYAALSWWPEAIKAYAQAIQDDPSHHWDYALMGDAQCRVGHPHEALLYYQQAVALGNRNTGVAAAIEHIAQYGHCPP
jgi:tetratricopeptide (TPR) repeat protein